MAALAALLTGPPSACCSAGYRRRPLRGPYRKQRRICWPTPAAAWAARSEPSRSPIAMQPRILQRFEVPRLCWRRRRDLGAPDRPALGNCWQSWRRNSRTGLPSSQPARRSVRPPRQASPDSSVLARQTTWFASALRFWTWSRRRCRCRAVATQARLVGAVNLPAAKLRPLSCASRTASGGRGGRRT